MKGRIRWAAIGGLAAAAAIGGGAFAGVRALAGDGTEIHACAQKENGQLRLSVDGTCRPSEQALAWSRGGLESLDSLQGTACTMGGRVGVTYLLKADGLTRFDVYPQCLMPDGSEPNDTRATAKELPTGVGPSFRTIYPAGEQDWLSVTGKPLQSLGVYTQAIGSTAPVTIELYRDGEPLATGAQRPDGTWALRWYTGNPYDHTPHDWLLHVTSSEVQLYLIELM